jgi:flagellar protein FliS
MSQHHAEAAAAYLAASLENAPPLKIVLELYKGALRALERARRMDPEVDRAAFVHELVRADRIVSELRFSIDPDPSPELAARLEGLYLFVESQVAEALAERSAEPLVSALAVLTRLNEGWRGIDLSTAGRAA